MKQINLSQIGQPNKKHPYLEHRLYRVSLGNGYVFKSKSVIKARAFLAQTNKFLNLQLHTINRLYIEVFRIYRANWFYLENNFEDLETLAIKSFKNIDDRFNLIIKRGDWTNGNHYVFNHLLSVTDTMHELCVAFSKLQYKKSNMPEYYAILSVINDLEIITKKINEYGYLPGTYNATND